MIKIKPPMVFGIKEVDHLVSELKKVLCAHRLGPKPAPCSLCLSRTLAKDLVLA